MNEEIVKFDKTLVFVICVFISFFFGWFMGINFDNNASRPVEEIIKADSIIKVNDSIKIKVEQLDSIKDAKIIEVQSLDNDSTVKLFYELISK